MCLYLVTLHICYVSQLVKFAACVSTPLGRSRKSTERKALSARPQKAPRTPLWVSASCPIKWKFPPTWLRFVQSCLSKSPDVKLSFSRSTPCGYKTPDNKVSDEVEVINNRLRRICHDTVFMLRFPLPAYFNVFGWKNMCVLCYVACLP